MNSNTFNGNLNINAIYLKNRMLELGIKQWWLAEQVGVDRKTVSRWLQGRVRSIQPENAQHLAAILEAPLSSILLGDSQDQLATVDQQRKAAELLLQSSIVERLGPIGEWNVIESLLKAVIVPDLPAQVLAELYDQLTIASWRQSKIEQAAVFNAKAEELALEIVDYELLARTLRSKANIFSWRGQLELAIRTYRDCLSYAKYLDNRELGSTYSNLGAVLYEVGRVSEGRIELENAIKSFEKLGEPINFSIVWIHFAILALQSASSNIASNGAQHCEIDRALECCNRAETFAKTGESKRGLAMIKLLRADIFSRKGVKTSALESLNQSLEEFKKLNISEPQNFEIAGRTMKNLGDFEQAELFLREGIACGKNFPIYLAAVHAEMTEVLLLSSNRNTEAKAEFQNAIHFYEKSEAPIRIQELRKKFDKYFL